jgi:hypothetical protein
MNAEGLAGMSFLWMEKIWRRRRRGPSEWMIKETFLMISRYKTEGHRFENRRKQIESTWYLVRPWFCLKTF